MSKRVGKRVSRAVAENRAPAEVEEDTPERRLWRNLDYFPTPPWAARAMAHRLRQYDPGCTTVWEPACGEGHMAEPLKEVFSPGNVFASDIYGYGYGAACDFLTAPPVRMVDWVMTNPPFELANEFIEQGLRIASRGVLVLCRIAFLESEGRFKLLYQGANRMTCIMPFAERVNMQLGSWDPQLSSATCYAAFAFFKGRQPEAHQIFPPGTRLRYELPTDAARFAHAAPIPLFEKMSPGSLFTNEPNQLTDQRAHPTG